MGFGREDIKLLPIMYDEAVKAVVDVVLYVLSEVMQQVRVVVLV